jgi:hypothetical protein
MNTLLLSVLFAGIPTPHFAVTMPTPKFTSLPVPKFSDVPQSQAIAEATHHSPETRQISPTNLALTGKRLPGPVHWRCPTCGSSSCLMYLGGHLRQSHKVLAAVLGRTSWRRLQTVHDNLHNAARDKVKAKPKPQSEPEYKAPRADPPKRASSSSKSRLFQTAVCKTRRG